MRAILDVSIPRERVCDEHDPPFDAFCAAYFAEHPIMVWEASRGFGGKSFLLAVLSLTEQVTLGADVTLLGGSGEQSKNIHTYMGELWDAPHAPTWMLKTDPTRTETRLTNGARVKALTASQRSVRGPHPQRLRMDEIDEMDLDVFDAALGQTMEGGSGIAPQTVCSSTHQHADGTMTEVKRRAREQGFPVFEWCYRESMEEAYGWLSEGEVQRKRATVPKVMWESEYELQEPAPESRAIDPAAVDAAFRADLGSYEGRLGEDCTLIGPDEGELFYHGTDWAKEQDWTVIVTFERRVNGPDVCAAWKRVGRMPWPAMVKAHNDRVTDYGGASAHDATGVGNVVSDYLNVSSRGFDFSHRKRRDEMLSDYVAAIEDGQIVYPMIDWAYREHKFCSYEQLYGSDHLPDSVAAGALAWWARRRARHAGGVALIAGV